MGTYCIESNGVLVFQALDSAVFCLLRTEIVRLSDVNSDYPIQMPSWLLLLLLAFVPWTAAGPPAAALFTTCDAPTTVGIR